MTGIVPVFNEKEQSSGLTFCATRYLWHPNIFFSLSSKWLTQEFY